MTAVRKYIALTRAGIIEMLSFRLATLVMIVGNIIYLTVIYFLWRSIFDSSPTPVVNGMTFESTIIYLVLATAIFNFMEMYTVWEMGRAIQSGKIVLDLVRPMEYRSYLFWSFTGATIMQFITTFIPTFIAVEIVTGFKIPLGINIVYFLISLTLGVVINYSIDFIVGTICLYSESIWGINIMKQVIVLLFSGATIPLAFFPETLYKIASVLPFKAVYDGPLTILLSGSDVALETVLPILGLQLLWAVILYILSIIFWKISIRQITVNGG